MMLAAVPNGSLSAEAELEMSKGIDQIITALSKAQSELDNAKKDQSGYGYNYSDLKSVITTAKPVLAKYGLAITQLVGQTDSNVHVTTILGHTSGQFFKSTASLPVIDMKGCNKAQGAGASISYLRRYSYQSILGMVSEDNDASSEGFSKKAPAKKAPAKTEVKKSSFDRRKRSTSNDDDL